jgi:hypothetical protein
VEAFIIVGSIFMFYLSKLEDDLSNSGLMGVLLFNQNNQLIESSGIGTILVLLGAIFFTIFYILETKTYASFYWFMQTGPGNVTFGLSGIYYIIMGFILYLFISLIAYSHSALFQISGKISAKLMRISENRDIEQLRDCFENEHLLKEQLAPLSRVYMVSRLFFLVITLNLITWKFNEPNVGFAYRFAVFFLFIIGLMFFSMPRYYIQFHIFSIWKRLDKHTYIDLRMPWYAGITTILDILILAILVQFLLPDFISSIIRFFG